MVKSASKTDPPEGGNNGSLFPREKSVVTPESIAKIRSDFKRNIPIKEISRKRGISRNTVRTIIRSETIDHVYKRKSQPYPQLGPFRERLEEILKEHCSLPKKQRPPLTRVFEILQQEGYTGCYDNVRRFSGSWLAQNQVKSETKAYLPLSFQPAEAYQFDWSSEVVFLGNIAIQVKVAHFTLCHSRMRFSRIYRREKLEMVMDAHVRAFEFFGGTCERGIYDNMKTAVDKILRGKDRKWNLRFLTLLSHYGLDPDPCNPASGWEKGRVERGVQTSRNDFFKPYPKGPSLEDLNKRLLEDCIQRARQREHPEIKGKSVWDVYLEEKASLFPIQEAFDAHMSDHRPVSKDCLVNYDRNRYSVHHDSAHQPVELRAYADRLKIFREGRCIGDHQRAFGRDKTIFDPVHYLPLLEKRPNALRNALPFSKTNLPSPLRKVWDRLESHQGGDRSFVKILCAARTFGFSAVTEACKKALEDGCVSQEVILNLLNRGAPKGDDPENIELPDHLILQEEPSDDCSVYNEYLGEGACLENPS